MVNVLPELIVKSLQMIWELVVKSPSIMASTVLVGALFDQIVPFQVVDTNVTLPLTIRSSPLILFIYQLPELADASHTTILNPTSESESIFCKSCIALKLITDCVLPEAVVVLPQMIEVPMLIHEPLSI